MKTRKEQIEVEFDAFGNVVEATFCLVVHSMDIHLVRLSFDKSYEGKTYEFEIREDGLRHFGELVIAVYDGKLKEEPKTEG